MADHMNSVEQDADNEKSTADDQVAFRYARCISASKRVRWTVEEVIQGRTFEMTQNFLPNGFAKAAEFPSLSSEEMRLVSQIQRPIAGSTLFPARKTPALARSSSN